MQTTEFDKLFDEKQQVVQAIFSDNTNSGKLIDLLNNLDKSSKEGLNKANEILRENQTPLPDKKLTEIRNFVNDQRRKNIKDRQIRRAVIKKFNITVIPK